MRWLHTEYLLKGLYLGLLALAGWRAATAPTPSWQTPVLVTASSFAGLALALAVAAFGKLREGYRIKGRLLAFVLFLSLESPTLVYAGILLGTAAGALALHLVGDDARLLAATLGGGVAVARGRSSASGAGWGSWSLPGRVEADRRLAMVSLSAGRLRIQ